MRSRPAGRRPLFNFAGLWSKAADETAGEIAVVDQMIGIVCDASRSRVCVGQNDFLQIERLRVNAADLVRAKLAEVSGGVWPDDDSVRQRVRRRHLFQNDLSSFRIETTDKVTVLRGEEDHPIAIEDQAVRILRAGIGHGIFGDVASARIEFADIGFEVCSEPDIAIFASSQTMRTRVGSFERKLFNSSGRGI